MNDRRRLDDFREGDAISAEHLRRIAEFVVQNITFAGCEVRRVGTSISVIPYVPKVPKVRKKVLVNFAGMRAKAGVTPPEQALWGEDGRVYVNSYIVDEATGAATEQMVQFCFLNDPGKCDLLYADDYIWCEPCPAFLAKDGNDENIEWFDNTQYGPRYVAIERETLPALYKATADESGGYITVKACNSDGTTTGEDITLAVLP